MFNDAQYKARNNLVVMEDKHFGKVHVPSVCPVLSETPGEIKWLGPDIGEYNDEIYKNLLKIDDITLKTLKEKGVI
ncbi:hypothetical protein [Fusobacterium sp. PH5-29]|uniref:hypothetical protein n=1 Tax=Fusobacterium sp. PH5-29 TaxID=1742400 RepID=UPI003D1F6AAA